MLKRIVLIAVTFTLAGCLDPNTMEVASAPDSIRPTDHALVRHGIGDRLKDPESAQYRNMRAFNLSNGDRAICGEFNARNSFGGYTGYSPFWIRTRSNSIVAAEIAGVNDTFTESRITNACQQAASGKVMVMPGA